MNKKIGFIGCGNMGKAMLSSLLQSNIKKENIIVSEKFKENINKIKNEFHVETTTDNKIVAKKSDILIIAVKPFYYKEVIDEIKNIISNDIIIISIAAGVTISDLETWFEKDTMIVRTMPNTPALVGEGMSAICPNKNVTKESLEEVLNIFSAFGKYELLEERLFHGFIALAGSSPAYFFMFIEAMADAGVKLGIPRDKAYKIASQSMLGSAKLVLESGKHPAELKDMVCSPEGTTIEAVLELEKNSFRSTVCSALNACAEKSKNM